MNELLKKLLVDHDSDTRKMAPVQTGFNDYFPEAILAVALMSYLANEKHNPGQELHWSWDISDDHPDCVARHALRDNTFDQFGLPHKVAKAWRAMADLQKYLVDTYDLPLPPSAHMTEGKMKVKKVVSDTGPDWYVPDLNDTAKSAKEFYDEVIKSYGGTD